MLLRHGEELIPGRKPARNKLSQLLVTNRCGGGGWVKPQTSLMPEVRLGGGQPRDKAKVQACVRIVERWLLGRLRNRIAEHMPASHRRYGDWTPAKFREEAGRIGPMMSLLVEKIIENRPHPEQGYRSCLGIIGLEKRFGADRLEAAALRALEVQARNYPSIKSILEKGLDRVPVPTSLMIGGLSILMPMPATICSKFSKIAMGCAQLWSPARSR